jgi:hypothetical protein
VQPVRLEEKATMPVKGLLWLGRKVEKGTDLVLMTIKALDKSDIF